MNAASSISSLPPRYSVPPTTARALQGFIDAAHLQDATYLGFQRSEETVGPQTWQLLESLEQSDESPGDLAPGPGTVLIPGTSRTLEGRYLPSQSGWQARMLEPLPDGLSISALEPDGDFQCLTVRSEPDASTVLRVYSVARGGEDSWILSTPTRPGAYGGGGKAPLTLPPGDGDPSTYLPKGETAFLALGKDGSQAVPPAPSDAVETQFAQALAELRDSQIRAEARQAAERERSAAREDRQSLPHPLDNSKARAMEYVQKGDFREALWSMVSDLENLLGHQELMGSMALAIAAGGYRGEDVTKFIQGFGSQ